MYPPEPDSARANAAQLLRPGFRITLAFLFIVLTALLPRRLTPLYLVPTGILILCWAVTGLPVRYAVRRLLAAEFFIVGVALLCLLHPSTTPVFLASLAKSNLCVLAMVILTWVTPFHSILHQLRSWGLPAVMVTTLALMYRYLPVLGEETRRMSRARASRSFVRSRWVLWKDLSLIVAQLFIRTTERAERIFLAMCARGWK